MGLFIQQCHNATNGRILFQNVTYLGSASSWIHLFSIIQCYHAGQQNKEVEFTFSLFQCSLETFSFCLTVHPCMERIYIMDHRLRQIITHQPHSLNVVHGVDLQDFMWKEEMFLMEIFRMNRVF
jgi:hypothetical protein